MLCYGNLVMFRSGQVSAVTLVNAGCCCSTDKQKMFCIKRPDPALLLCRLSSLFPPSLPLELSDAVCLCLPLQEVRLNPGMLLFPPPPPPRSSQLFPLSSLSLPQRGSSAPIHQSWSLTCVPQRGDEVTTGLQQLFALPEHPRHSAPHFPPLLCAPPSWHPGAVVLLVSEQWPVHQKDGENKQPFPAWSLTTNYLSHALSKCVCAFEVFYSCQVRSYVTSC